LTARFCCITNTDMGRPRDPNRMSRMVQARVTDEQYDWLIERAVDEEGDMSKALRDTFDSARIFHDLLAKADPPKALREFLKRSEQEQAREEAEGES
jgi:hypothetical protein